MHCRVMVDLMEVYNINYSLIVVMVTIIVTDITTSQGMPAERAAYHSLEAIASKERETFIIKPLFQLALYLKFIWPAALDWILRKRAKID